MKPVLIFTAVIAVFFAAARHTTAAENQLTSSEKAAGWKLLFDGQTTKGWRNYKKDAISDGWAVEDGALVRAKAGAGDIVTLDQYDNFELSIEYRIAEGGNSGIMFHVTEEADAPWQTGPEVQVLDNLKGHDPQKSGWLYQLYQAYDKFQKKPVDATRPAGQWNHVQLLVTKDQGEINMNGWRYCQFQLGSKDWDERVAKSKFAAFPGFGKAARGHLCLQDHGDRVAYRNIKLRELKPDGTAVEPVTGDLKVKGEPAFANIRWAGWQPETEEGVLDPLRPIIITNAGDGSNRVFMATEQGVIYSFANDQQASHSKIFLDLRDRVHYYDPENEEGFLGFAFHPDYKRNGQMFVYYTARHTPHLSVVSRFQVSKDNPDQADPKSEEELLTIPQPFWNHKGGTLAFGPDRLLYIALGDGGSANDPFANGQNLNSLLGKILRIDVNHKSPGLKYAIPKDNPFLGRNDARPEIFAYGFRNIWRMAFDRKTGVLWCADVGQNLWEEINLVTKGGNYGWSLREGTHPFGPGGGATRTDFIEPIWEYDHQVGKSITGGTVYRGKRVPELVGKYVYADYVTGKIWALDYDADQKKVRGNYRIPSPTLAIINFGEDEAGELYFTVVDGDGKGILRFSPAE